MNLFGRILIVSGAILMGLGLLFVFGGRVPWIGRLPGDIYIQKKNFTFYFPIATSIILSVLFSLIMILFRRR